MIAALTAVPLVPAPRTGWRRISIPAPRPAPLATVADLLWCTCLVPLDGTRPHYRHCDLRGGI